jgi:DNA repair protein RAD50
MKAELEGHGFDKQLEEKTRSIRQLEDERERINTELTSISLQADTRAKLGLKREESRRKDQDIKDWYACWSRSEALLHDFCSLEAMGPKHRQLIGHDPVAETAEREIDRATTCVPSWINGS